MRAEEEGRVHCLAPNPKASLFGSLAVALVGGDDEDYISFPGVGGAHRSHRGEVQEEKQAEAGVHVTGGGGSRVIRPERELSF